jgi:hypothetical protein
MSYHISWTVPDHVVAVTLTGPILASEVQTIADQLFVTVSAAADTQLVHMIVDAREATIQDKLWNYAKLSLKRHPNNGWTIVLGDSRLTGLVIAIFAKVLNSHIQYSESPATALKLICDRDAVVMDMMKAAR